MTFLSILIIFANNLINLLKKSAGILLLLIFLVPFIGLSINYHYCGNRLVTISLKHVDDCCKNCNHCHNKTIKIKINDSFESINDNHQLHSPSVSSGIIYNSIFILRKFIDIDFTVNVDISPPNILSEQSFLEVFRN